MSSTDTCLASLWPLKSKKISYAEERGTESIMQTYANKDDVNMRHVVCLSWNRTGEDGLSLLTAFLPPHLLLLYYALESEHGQNAKKP